MGWQLAKDANRTLGGGMASIELMRRSFAKRGWLDDSEHALLVAVSRDSRRERTCWPTVPGWGGWRIAWLGVAVALAVASLPGALAVTLMSAVIARLVASPVVRGGLAVATLVAAALILSSAWALVQPHVFGSRRVWALAFALAAAALFASGVTPIRVLLLSAVFGALSPPREGAS